ncbi:MAG: TRAP transporter small permease subunit [Alphaproteobacteria bacterium]
MRDPIGRFATALNLKLSWFYAIAVAVTAYEVVMRYGLNSPTIWVHDTAIALCAIAFVYGGAYAMVKNQHINITSLYDNLPRGWKRCADTFNWLCTFVFLAALTYAATIQASRSVALMETSGRAWDVPIPALLKTLLAVGALLMAALALDRLIRAVRGRSEG